MPCCFNESILVLQQTKSAHWTTIMEMKKAVFACIKASVGIWHGLFWPKGNGLSQYVL